MYFIIIKYTKVNLFEKLKLKNKNFYVFLYYVDVQSRCAHPTLYKKPTDLLTSPMTVLYSFITVAL